MYLIKILGIFDPPLPFAYKFCPFMTPPSPYKWLRNTWMFPCELFNKVSSHFEATTRWIKRLLRDRNSWICNPWFQKWTFLSQKNFKPRTSGEIDGTLKIAYDDLGEWKKGR